jgi:hypothetical protein
MDLWLVLAVYGQGAEEASWSLCSQYAQWTQLDPSFSCWLLARSTKFSDANPWKLRQYLRRRKEWTNVLAKPLPTMIGWGQDAFR